MTGVLGGSIRVWQVKELATTPGSLSSIPQNPHGGRRDPFPEICPLTVTCGMCVCVCVHHQRVCSHVRAHTPTHTEETKFLYQGGVREWHFETFGG